MPEKAVEFPFPNHAQNMSLEYNLWSGNIRYTYRINRKDKIVTAISGIDIGDTNQIHMDLNAITNPKLERADMNVGIRSCDRITAVILVVQGWLYHSLLSSLFISDLAIGVDLRICHAIYFISVLVSLPFLKERSRKSALHFLNNSSVFGLSQLSLFFPITSGRTARRGGGGSALRRKLAEFSPPSLSDCPALQLTLYSSHGLLRRGQATREARVGRAACGSDAATLIR
jgi:hypothetical protein